VIASALMLLRPRVATPLVAAIVLGYATVSLLTLVNVDHEGPPSVITFVVYAVTFMFIGGVGLYGAARLVRALDELHATRAELAELAVGRERLRVSRDLHDLLGHSLSAVSLKGDLAIRLLRSDPPAARAEIASLTQVARDALHGVRAVTRDEHVVSLRTETDGAAALLRAAGIDAHINLNVPGLPRPVEDVLAWAVREGVTNVLRHSDARTCSIVAGCHDGLARLEIVNDGVRSLDNEPTSGDGSGLAGLAERARAVAGLVSANCTDDGRFEVHVTIPQEVA
jgi:two-component system sensor histidine kinase DesK